jgi:hypothetical protein
MSLEMAHKVIVPQKKIMSRSFLNSGTLIVILAPFSLTQFTHERVLCSFSGFEAEIEKPATWLPGDTLRVLENRILIHNAKPNPEHIIYRYFLVIDWLINLKSIPEWEVSCSFTNLVTVVKQKGRYRSYLRVGEGWAVALSLGYP